MYGQPTQYGQPLLTPTPPPNVAGAALNAMMGSQEMNMGMGMGGPSMMGPPMMGPPMMGPPMMGPGRNVTNTIVINQGGSRCPFCNENTSTIPRLAVGCVTWSWCIGLALTTVWCFFIPFCVDSCKDVEQVCERCSNVKGVVRANCCWYQWTTHEISMNFEDYPVIVWGIPSS